MLLLLKLDAFPALNPDAAAQTIVTTRVKLSADETSLQTSGGQAALVASFVILAQMGLRITLDVPDVPIVGRQPPLMGTRLRAGLFAHAEQLIQPCANDEEHDLVVALGVAYAEPNAYRLSSHDAGITIQKNGEPRAWEAGGPIEGAVAGVLAGATALPIIIRRIEAQGMLLAAPQLRVTHETITVRLPALDTSRIVEIGEVDIISGGAITNAALFSLLRCDLRGRLRVFDDDFVEGTNLNRYALLRRRDVGQRKVEVLECFGLRQLPIIGMPSRYGASPSQSLASTVLVGADNVETRHLAQNAGPAWLHVGGTTHFEIISTAHEPGRPCAACLHPVAEAGQDNEIPTISFVSMLAGTLQAHALLAHALGHSSSHYYCWAANLGGPSGVVQFQPTRNPTCPLHCEARRRRVAA